MATLLIVDDLMQVRMLLKACLDIGGHTVLTAENGAAALELCREHRIDLLLIDRSMPGIDGLETIRRYRAAYPDSATRIVLMTGDDGHCDPTAGPSALGIHRIMRKPFGVADVRQLVDAELAQLPASADHEAPELEARPD